MKAKLLSSILAFVATNASLTALAIPSDFDYKKGAEEYWSLPDIALPYRALPSKFDLPVITEMTVDESITTDSPITDEFVNNIPEVASGISLDELPRIRSEYTRALQGWGDEVGSCLEKKPALIRKSTGNPVIINGVRGTIVLNANNRAVCK